MKVLICGATGYGNLGDDVIRNIYVDHILSAFPKTKVVITRPYPQDNLVIDSDGVIIGGGGILYDTVQTNFEYFSRYADVAFENGIPYALIGVGFQGEFKDENLPKLKSMLKNASRISVRQIQDKEYLNTLGFDALIGKDSAYLIKPVTNLEITSYSGKIKVAIIPGQNDSYLIENLKEIVELNKDVIDFYVVCLSAEDMPKVELLSKEIDEDGSIRDFRYFTPEIISTLLGEMDAVYTGRFHGIPFALSGGCKKIIGFGNRIKIKQELPESNYVEVLDTKNFWPLYLSCEELPKVNDHLHLDVLTNFVQGLLR